MEMVHETWEGLSQFTGWRQRAKEILGKLERDREVVQSNLQRAQVSLAEIDEAIAQIKEFV